MINVIQELVEEIHSIDSDDIKVHASLADLGLEREEASEMQVTFYYNKDRKTYNLSVTPISREDNIVRMIPMNGARIALKTVARKSARANREARQSITPELVMELIEATR